MMVKDVYEDEAFDSPMPINGGRRKSRSQFVSDSHRNTFRLRMS